MREEDLTGTSSLNNLNRNTCPAHIHVHYNEKGIGRWETNLSIGKAFIIVIYYLKAPSGQNWIVPLQWPYFFQKPQRVLNFLFWSWILKGDQSSLLLNTKISPIPSFFEGRLVLKSYFLFAGALLFDEKICHRAAQAFFWTISETLNHPPNMKFMVATFFGDWFVEKVGTGSLSTYCTASYRPFFIERVPHSIRDT